jgi:predicted  nucleic acid-binding Zn-ribbon protein
MQDVFDKLRSLQEILSQKFEVENEINDIPRALATKTELLNRLKKTYIQKNEELVKSKEKIKSTRQKMQDAELEREKYERQMDLIKTQREYEALDKEIKDASEREQDFRRELQNEERMLEEMQDNLEKEEVMIANQEEEVKSEQSRIKHELKEKQKVLQKLERDEKKVTPGLDEELLFKFERIIRSKAGLGIVPLIDGVCTGCFVILPPQFVNDVRASNNIMFCPDCSRILFFQEKEEADYTMDIFQSEEGEAQGQEEEAEDEEEGEEEDSKVKEAAE